MIRGWFLAVLTGLALTPTAPAQSPARFSWKAGQVLTYRIEHVTSASEVSEGAKEDTVQKLNLVKNWKVLEVDEAGTATVQLWVSSMRREITRPNGEVLLFDSADPDKSNPQMREQLVKYINQTLAVLRITNKGKVVEVKQCKEGSAARYDSRPPFVLTLPDDPLQAQQGWEREYAVTLEPPVGTGEKFPAVQKYVCKKIDGVAVTIGLTTTLKSLPMALADQIPLLEMQPEGEIVFDAEEGCLVSARLNVVKELKDHQGEGSSYRLQSTYTETRVGNN